MYYILYFIFYKNNIISIRNFTPLKIYIGTPEGVPLEIQGQQLPINELNGTPLLLRLRRRVPFQIFIGVKRPFYMRKGVKKS